LWVLDERKSDPPTCGKQFINCSVEDLEKENLTTEHEIVKEDENKIHV
jgi:hypothetical protein